MGNFASLGINSTDLNASARVNHIERLPPHELKRLLEGYRRICNGLESKPTSPTLQSDSKLPIQTNSGKSGSKYSVSAEKSSAHSLATRSKHSSTLSAKNSSIKLAKTDSENKDPEIQSSGRKNDAPSLRQGYLTKRIFRTKVLDSFPMIPHSLADRLFDVLDTNKSDRLTAEKVLSGISWLKFGEKEEIELLLFIIYDVDNRGELTRDMLTRFIVAIYGPEKAREHTVLEFFSRIFDGRAALSLDAFRQVAHERDANGTLLLTDWLTIMANGIAQQDDPEILRLEQEYNPVVVRHRIATSTLFSDNEIASLERQLSNLEQVLNSFEAVALLQPALRHLRSNAFRKTRKLRDAAAVAQRSYSQEAEIASTRTSISGNSRVYLGDVVKNLRHYFPLYLIQKFFGQRRRCEKEQRVLAQYQNAGMSSVYSEECLSVRDCYVTLEEFCFFLSHFCRGSLESKLRHVYNLLSVSSGEPAEDCQSHVPSQHIQELQSSISEYLHGFDPMALEAFIRDADQANPSDCDWPAFLEYSQAFPCLEECLNQMSFVACYVFNIKPDTGYLEKRIVQWHWAQAGNNIRQGQCWNLIGGNWWRSWCSFSEMSVLNGTRYGALPLPRLPEIAEKNHATAAEIENMYSQMHNAFSRKKPRPIASWNLLRRSGSRRLNERIVLGRDYFLIPSRAYAELANWYSGGGPDIIRVLVPANKPNFDEKDTESIATELILELFPLVLRVARVEPLNGLVNVSGEEVILSFLSTYGSLLEATCKALLFMKQIKNARLWYYHEQYTTDKFPLWQLARDHYEDKIITSVNEYLFHALTQQCVLLLELQDADGSWPLSQADSTVTKAVDLPLSKESMLRNMRPRSAFTREKKLAPQPMDSDSSKPMSRSFDLCAQSNLEALLKSGKRDSSDEKSYNGVTPHSYTASPTLDPIAQRRFMQGAFSGDGLVGLENLGNTCYMSSALQCLSHTRLLVEYLRKQAYLSDINDQNRDGHQGKLAIAFGELIRALWTSQNTKKRHFAPIEFKKTISKLRPQFQGSEQHDAQEFLAFLLSGLSEDLNRVMVKPYAELQDSNGRSDSVVANEWWDNHLKREVSVIVALFTGQYKSLLECCVCRYESARFEPFTFLQLSLPESHSRTILVTVLFSNCRPPLQCSIRVKKTSAMQVVLNQVAQIVSKQKNHFSKVSADQFIIARTTTQHTIDTIIDERKLLSSVSETDTLRVFELDPLPTCEENPSAPPSLHVGASVYITQEVSRELLSARIVRLQGTDSVDVAFPSGAKRYSIPRHRVMNHSEAKLLGQKCKSIQDPRIRHVQSTSAYIFLVHRRVYRTSQTFTKTHVARLFGVPLILRVSLSYTSNYDLYVLVWQRLRRIFHWKQPPAQTQFSFRANELHRSDLCTIALGTQLPLTQFGFCLRLVTSSGLACSRCEWLNACMGCLILPSSETICVTAEESIAIDWDTASLKTDYDPLEASKMVVDASVEQNLKKDQGPLTLEQCLNIFTAQEHINEAYCGRCKTLRPATKTMDFWKLPPILVIHLKRFCYTQMSRRKLYHIVDFPLRGFDMRNFVAKRRRSKRMYETGLIYWRFLGGLLHEEEAEDDDNEDASDDYVHESDAKVEKGSLRQEKELEIDTSPFRGVKPAMTKQKDLALYDLYAVVNHVGALATGHYFAYIKSEGDGKWRCFNDHQCKDIDEKEVVSSSAYILFYIRRDIQNLPIEQLFAPTFPVSTNNSSSEPPISDSRVRSHSFPENSGSNRCQLM